MTPVRALALILLLLLGTPDLAHAYIDGGSAHLVVQGLIAAVVGGLYYIRNPREIWRALVKRFRRDRR